ncbi:polysaccharide pyruvyl transferase family protein [Bacteroides sp.]|uniref:polysaccharide pyruvyl transferase family protein n=1 Tax=Bacteroides sp. TaxID=29523 RepID=UPI0025BD1EDD|nr:polysaccharide pyruvyl transferase family protein [Bacteroides sp.]
MKIGILTFHQAHNYGAVLQCYALKDILSQMGHEVEVIDYRQPYLEKHYAVLNSHKIITNLFHFNLGVAWKLISSIYPNFRRRELYRKFLKRYFSLTRSCSINNIPIGFDAYIIGSDQLWSKECLGGELDPVYFGNFAHSISSRLITYAVSSNDSSIKELIGVGSSQFDNLCNISLREEKYALLLSKAINREVTVDIDPVLLAGASVWFPLLDDKWKGKRYIVKCLYRDWFSHKADIEKFVDLNECKEVDLTSKTYSLIDFVSSIYYSDLVLATSFHATIFAIIFHKPFICLKLSDGNDERCENLLNILGLSSNMYIKIPISQHHDNINWNSVEIKLEKLRRRSIQHLTEPLR